MAARASLADTCRAPVGKWGQGERLTCGNGGGRVSGNGVIKVGGQEGVWRHVSTEANGTQEQR